MGARELPLPPFRWLVACLCALCCGCCGCYPAVIPLHGFRAYVVDGNYGLGKAVEHRNVVLQAAEVCRHLCVYDGLLANLAFDVAKPSVHILVHFQKLLVVVGVGVSQCDLGILFRDLLLQTGFIPGNIGVVAARAGVVTVGAAATHVVAVAEKAQTAACCKAAQCSTNNRFTLPFPAELTISYQLLLEHPFRVGDKTQPYSLSEG